jgi:hypothetical protein
MKRNDDRSLSLEQALTAAYRTVVDEQLRVKVQALRIRVAIEGQIDFTQ